MGYQVILENVTDKNYQDDVQVWSVADTLSGITIVIAIYIVLVLKALPDYMKNRSPYKLKNLLLFYNAFQVVFSAYIVYKYGKYLITEGLFTTECHKGEAMKAIIRNIYPYFIAKHMDLLDTIFFVLRKKDNQITFLHLFHHSSMITWTWLHLMHYPTDHFVFVGLLNSFVHVLMYSYYGISSLGPEYAKFVWWKKHLTMVQLIQFVLVVSHLHYQQKLSPCPLPLFFHYFCMGSIISFFLLFMNFYVNSYRNRRSKKELCKENHQVNGDGRNDVKVE